MNSWLKNENYQDLVDKESINESYTMISDGIDLRRLLTNVTELTVSHGGTYWFMMLNCESAAT